MKNISPSDIGFTVQKFVSSSFGNSKLNKNFNSVSPVVSYEELIKQVKRSISNVKNGLTFGETYESLFIWGNTGTGKTEIIKQIALEEGCVYHKLEIQKVPIEELAGFPFIEKNTKNQTVVRLAHPTILPPSDNEETWVLHLDEFNKADTEQMAAVMNLVLNGEIGGSSDYDEKTGQSLKYKLPKKTVIIGCGNPKIQKNVNNFNSVNAFDTATAERWHRNLFINYDVLSWLNSYGFKEFYFNEEKLSTRIPPIIIYYLFDKYSELNNAEAPFLIAKKLSSEETEGDSTMSPRAWTLASNAMTIDAYSLWKESDRKLSFQDFFFQPDIQIKTITENVYEFGYNGKELVSEIIARYTYFFENMVLPRDVLFDYSNIRDKVRKLKEKKGALLYLLIGVASEIKGLEQEPTDLIPFVNLSTMFQDTDIPVEDLTLFIFELNNNGTEISKKFSDTLFSINEKFKNAYQGYYHVGKQELGIQ